MRLALYSDQEVPANAAIDERVLRLIGVVRPRIGYVSAAPDPERSDFERKRRYYEKLGADLAAYVDSDTGDLERALAELFRCDAIHLGGGNTFSFLRWLKARCVLPWLGAWAAEGRGVLIGVSAGAILMTPAVGTATLCGDVREPGPIDDDALGLVGFHFWPHYVPGAEQAPASRAVIESLPALYACEDGAGIVVDGADIELYGAVQIARRE